MPSCRVLHGNCLVFSGWQLLKFWNHGNCSRSDHTWQLQLSNHGNCSCPTWQPKFSDMATAVKRTWTRVWTMATAGRAVTVTRACGTTRYEAWRTGRVGVIYFAHTHACERDREGKKEVCGHYFFCPHVGVWAVPLIHHTKCVGSPLNAHTYGTYRRPNFMVLQSWGSKCWHSFVLAYLIHASPQ